QMPIIAIGTKELKSEHTIWLEKPATIEKLNVVAKQLLEEISKPYSSKRQSKKPRSTEKNELWEKLQRAEKWSDKALENTASNESVKHIIEHYDPKQTLLGVVQNALQHSTEKNTAMMLICEGRLIEVDKEKDRIAISFDEKTLRALCRFTFNENNTTLNTGTLPLQRQVAEYTLSHFLWEIGLSCSRGRLPESLHEDHCYQLKHWPNLTRWQAPQHSMRISSVWSQSPLSAVAVANQLNISVAYVIAFLVAADAADIIQTNDRADKIISFDQPHKSRGVLRSFFNKLKWA
ncbi:MAG: hypothetical protein KAG18_08035, partial [Sinobacterium sp.]|nr:hypothetical protein [Sinobacterium sp.]